MRKHRENKSPTLQHLLVAHKALVNALVTAPSAPTDEEERRRLITMVESSEQALTNIRAKLRRDPTEVSIPSVLGVDDQIDLRRKDF